MKAIFILFLFVSIFANSVYAESVYDRKLNESLRENDLVTAKKMIEKGANVNSGGKSYKYSKRYSMDAYKLLIKNGWKMSAGDQCFLAEMIKADVDETLAEKVKLLVDNGADLHCYGNYYNVENASLAYQLADIISDNRYEPRIKAAKYILDSGAKKDLNKYAKNVNATISGRIISENQEKPIHKTCSTGSSRWINKSMFRAYIAAGTNLNEPINSLDYYPIHIAAFFNEVEALEKMIKNGADVNVVNKKGYSPADLARKRKHTDAEMLLIENGAKYVKYK